MSGRTRDPRNLFWDCAKHGVMDPRVMTQDNLHAELLVCKLNIANLEKNGPLFSLNFLKSLVSSATETGNTIRASKISGIIQKEKMRKR